MLPYGTVWNYVSSTILNGFINYVKPIDVYKFEYIGNSYYEL